MSEAQQPVVVSAPAVESATEPLVAPTATEAPAVATTDAEPTTETAPAVDAPVVAATTEPETAAATETAPVVADAAAETVVEPITEGQLAYKGPGLVKSLIPSKKEFWLSDAAVESQNLDLFLRGEKPEVAHPIAAWATQTGKGLLFFNKKGDTDRTHPADILPLYEATDLKKEPTHQFAFKIGASTHTFKATSDAERDGWYLSIEKAIELAKASKEEIQGQESYKSEVEKLGAPVVAGASKVKKTETEETEKKQKSRSTSRGLLGRLKGNKEETAEEKKEEETAAEESKAVEPVAAPTGEVVPAPVAVPAEAAVEETPAVAAAEEERPKPAKRQSIFGKFNIGGLKSPSKEKEQKEVEAAAPVSENPPVLPETATTEPASEVIIPVTENPTVPGETAAVPAEAVAAAPAPAAETTTSPTKEKSNFLSSFIKRSRSVSPSAALKDEPKLDEVATTAPTTTAAAEEPAVVAAPTEEPAAAATEATTEEAAPKEPVKRESVLGSLGRRASKAFKGINAPKKESTATSPVAATEATKEEETAVAATTTETAAPAAEETIKPAGETVAIADVVPEAVSVGQPTQTVAASA